MILSHKIRIYPNKEQEQGLVKACGCARFAYNWGLSEWTKQYKEGLKPNGYKIKKQFNAIKREKYPWIYESPKDANQRSFNYLQKAFNSFFKKRTHYPKFHKKGIKDSFYLSNDVIKLLGKTIYIPHIKNIKMAEGLRFSGALQSATVSRTADKWFISFSVNVGNYSKERISNKCIGVDLGIKSLATCSDGTVFDNLTPLKKNIKKLARLSKEHSRKIKRSNNRKKSQIKLSRLHYKITCKRSDNIHKMTTQLCSKNQTIVIEDLNVKGMSKNKKLSRSISDVGWGLIRQQLSYKSKIYKSQLVVADRFYPSSKTCSKCGAIREKLDLSERIFVCPTCGFIIDRDLNASINLCTLSHKGIKACGQDVRLNMEAILDEAGIHE